MNQTNSSHTLLSSMTAILPDIRVPFPNMIPHGQGDFRPVIIPPHCSSAPFHLLPSPTTPCSSLDDGFRPEVKVAPDSVVIGRGKKCHNHVGNKRLESLAKKVLHKYKFAATRLEKSNVVSHLIQSVEEAGGMFIKLTDDGRYVQASGPAAREKVGVVLRNLLSDKYRSSCKAKVKARQRRVERRRSGILATASASSTNETGPTVEKHMEELSLDQLLACDIILDLPGDGGEDSCPTLTSMEAWSDEDDDLLTGAFATD